MVDAENAIANWYSWIARIVVLLVWVPCLLLIGAFQAPVNALGAGITLVGLVWAIVYGVTDFSGVSTAVSTVVFMSVFFVFDNVSIVTCKHCTAHLNFFFK